jgi:hypothetical protein
MMAQQPLPAYESLQMGMPTPLQNILPSQNLSPSSAAKVGIPSIINPSEGFPAMAKSHASPESPNSLSLPQTSSPSRSSKMDIASLV